MTTRSHNTHSAPFKPVVTFVPEAEQGLARVRHVEIVGRGWTRFAPIPGQYAVLYVDGVLMMSDTQFEQDSNDGFVRAAHGQVLIAGLGLGMILRPILAKSDVVSVTVIEKYADVIAVVGPHLKNEKLEIIHADINGWLPPKGTKYDAIYFDIWPDVTTENLPEMARLHQRFKSYRNRLNPHSVMDSWLRDHFRNLRRTESTG